MHGLGVAGLELQRDAQDRRRAESKAAPGSGGRIAKGSRKPASVTWEGSSKITLAGSGRG
ncbi:hypothetical protein GCM10009799_23600 [Nocardiopsis rhodophaea]|uniref:Uncharacterized protein n=1 Tax=Nocardiopsis rhodophaea TaxID=280238 RepID=A0ABN2T0Y2_9ACTN